MPEGGGGRGDGGWGMGDDKCRDERGHPKERWSASCCALNKRDGRSLAWFKNTCFRVTHGISARTLIGPALERVYASPWLRCWGFSSARTACTPEVPASERAAHPSATPQDSCRLDWALHCAGTGGDSGRTEATSSSPSPSAAAGRSSCAAGC